MRRWQIALAILVLAQAACSVYWGEKKIVESGETPALVPALPTPPPAHSQAVRSEVLADVVRVRDPMFNVTRYIRRGEMVVVVRREGDWCWIGETEQVFCGCLSGFNAGLGCEAK